MSNVNFSGTSSTSANNYRGRYAPSPTGYLHLGNVWTALISWCAAQQNNGRWILRLEDLDRARCQKIYEDAMYEDLHALGFVWEEGPDVGGPYGPYRQSERLGIYNNIIEQWREAGQMYACTCSRARRLAIASAPHRGDHHVDYDGHCRWHVPERMKRPPSWRYRGSNETVTYQSQRGETIFTTMAEGADDILVLRADGVYSYQFAVAVDDAMMRITEVVRSVDLAESTGWQVRFMNALNLTAPMYWHIPLLCDREGIRLSKRQHGITVRELLKEGKTPADVLGYLGHLAGINPQRKPQTLQELASIDLAEWQLDSLEIRLKEGL